MRLGLIALTDHGIARVVNERLDMTPTERVEEVL